MAEVDPCEDIRICSREAPPETEIDDPSIGILPETDAGPVEAGPPVFTGILTPCDISFLQQNFKPLINVSKLAADAAVASFAAAALAVAGHDAAAAAAAAGYDAAAAFSSVDAVAKKARDDAAAEGRVPTETEQRDREGFVEPDEVSSNINEEITNIRDSNLLSVSFKIMGYIESQIKTDLLDRFSLVFDTLYKGLSVCVPDLPGDGATKGFVGINKCGFLSKYTTVIYYAGKIPYNYRTAIETLIGQCNDEVKPVIEIWNISGISFTCKVEKSPIQYDTQKIILCIKLPTGNVIQMPILNVVGFPVFEDVTPLLQQLGCVGAGHQQLPIFFTPQFQGVASAFIVAYPNDFTQFIASHQHVHDVTSVFIKAYPNEFTQFIASNPQAQGVVSAFIVAYPVPFAQFIASHQQAQGVASAFIAAHPAQFAEFIAQNPQAQGVATAFIATYPTPFAQFIASNPQAQGVANAFIAAYPNDFTQFIASNQQAQRELQTLSLLDIIVRVRLCANQGAITALSEPSKEEVTLILSCFQGLIPHDALPASINTITQAICNILYLDPRFDRNANIKPFALLCNIFYNFINVSLGFRSLAKIIYSDFFGTSDNYGKVIRACQVVNRLPIMNEHVKFFLTGSNAARVYLALNDIIKLGATISPDTIAPILSKTFGKLSDNDFMIYLKNAESEQYRVFIRMILGGSFYFFKDLFDPVTLARFTKMMIQSVGIVGYMDHLFAQRFDATPVFLRRCYEKDPSSFLATILTSMDVASMKAYFDNLDKQINVAHLDGVFKHYTLKKFYEEVFEIFQVIPADNVYDFLINHATSINCIATVWTLVLNVLYTLFVPENCLARIVVGKFDNDPKNLKLYMEILNDHLTELRSLPGNGTEFIDTINKLQELQTRIAHMCEVGIKRDLLLFKQTCDQWVQSMVSAVAQSEGPSNYKGLFMLSESDAYNLGRRFPTKLERALCLAYLPTSRGNICSAASPTGSYIFREQILKIVDLDTTHIEGILTSDKFRHDAGEGGEGIGKDVLQRLIECGVNDGNLDAFLILPSDTMKKKPFRLEEDLSKLLKDTCLKAPRKALISLSGTKTLALILHSLIPIIGSEARAGILLNLLIQNGVNDDNLNGLGNVEISLIQKKFSMSDQLAKEFIKLCRQQPTISGIMDPFEITLHQNLTTIGERIYVCRQASDAYGIEIKPERTIPKLSTYLNFMWKHLTKTAIHLKIFFKETLTDIKRVTGIKFIALVLGGYFQIRLLIYDVFVPGTFETFTRDPTMAARMADWISCKRGLLPLLREPLLALINEIIQTDHQTGTDYGDPISQILKILGFLFSIKVKSTSPHSPYHLLRLEDSMLRFKIDFEAEHPKIPFTTEILKPTKVMFIEFLTALGVPKAFIKCICSSKYNSKENVKNLDLITYNELNPSRLFLYDAVGGSNDSYSNSGRKSVYSLNKHKHKYKHNKLARNNRTHRNKKNRKKNSKSKSRKSKSKSNSGKSKRKNVTFKRRKRSNRH